MPVGCPLVLAAASWRAIQPTMAPARWAIGLIRRLADVSVPRSASAPGRSLGADLSQRLTGRHDGAFVALHLRQQCCSNAEPGSRCWTSALAAGASSPQNGLGSPSVTPRPNCGASIQTFIYAHRLRQAPGGYH